jgi:hypothetical protein
MRYKDNIIVGIYQKFYGNFFLYIGVLYILEGFYFTYNKKGRGRGDG